MSLLYLVKYLTPVYFTVDNGPVLFALSTGIQTLHSAANKTNIRSNILLGIWGRSAVICLPSSATLDVSSSAEKHTLQPVKIEYYKQNENVGRCPTWWPPATACVSCSNDANVGECNTWTQSEFCTWQTSARGQEAPKIVHQPRRRPNIMQSMVDFRWATSVQ